ncbi:hypothetical protein GGX14DRAFT_588203 [Mycena pura]|uniref:Uncharacterized protein n=1 Tax=Mycena pura TaxID=153505 RepID=A0AAD6Y4C1_9AGAR|nr:hypothetical protein GGX14DRAFT_588203 [Mycena pura]
MEKQQLPPDPGPQPRKSKPVRGPRRAVLVVFGASGVLLAVWIAVLVGQQFRDGLKPPHLALYQNQTWDQITNRSAVVRPLVSGDDRFDIIATVWLRGNASQRAAYHPDAAISPVGYPWENRIHREYKTLWFDAGARPTKAQDDIFEVALYSGIIIQNASLSDKGLTAEVPLEFPLGVFLEQKLTPEHLRASFVVSPSVKMDHLRNFSSWMPDYVLETQWRSRPASPTEQKSLIDRAIESFSLSVPMIDFHPIISHCDAILNAAGFTNNTSVHNQPWDSNARWHPHVTSRLHLRIPNEQHLFNLEAYNTVHDKLRRTSCGSGYDLGKGLPHRSVCSRTYEGVGPMETRLEFSDSETEWAYAPFLSAARNAAGPLDHIPVPVNRVNCSALASYNSTDLPGLEPSLLNDTMKVIWRVSFSGRTPRKMLFSDVISAAFAPAINDSHSERERIEAQVEFEHKNAFRSHRFHVDSHPRRTLVVYALRTLSGLFTLLLDVTYYWRLKLTVGISIRGQWLFFASVFAWAVLKLIIDSPDSRGKVSLGVEFFLSGVSLFAITRMKFSWRGFTWLPVIFAPATHTERASSRIDAKSSWRFIGTSMLILTTCFYVADRKLIPSPLPPDPGATAHSIARDIFIASIEAGYFMSHLLQLLMNHRARTFGGIYKASVWFMVVQGVFHFMVYIPVILGHIPNRAPLFLVTVIKIPPLIVQAWQAWTLPAAKTEEEEEQEK